MKIYIVRGSKTNKIEIQGRRSRPQDGWSMAGEATKYSK